MFDCTSMRARPWGTALATAALVAGVLATPVSAQRRPRRQRARTAAPSPSSCSPTSRPASPFQQALADEFTKQFPNVTWNIREDQFANLMQQTPLLLSGDNPPDLIRLPTMVGLVKDGLLLNLDPYVTAYGWDKWPPSLLVQNRVAEGGRPRGRARCTRRASTTA